MPPRGARSLLSGGAWRSAPLLMRSLGALLGASGLAEPLREALGIWTHVAGQTLEQAPSVLAFVPALVHTVGAFYAQGGIGRIPLALAAAADGAGARIDYGVAVRRIVTRDGRVSGVETAGGGYHEADAVVSNAGGVGTCLDLCDAPPPRAAERMRALPLQSPGVSAYVAVRGDTRGAYLRFLLPAARPPEPVNPEPCRLLDPPGRRGPGVARDGWWPARLLSPLDHARAEREGRAGQEEALDRVLAEPWWRAGLDEVRVLGRRVPADWGAEFRLHRDSMNPVMTARSCAAAAFRTAAPGSAACTWPAAPRIPGQWVSFCAISGVLAADRLLEDAR